MHTDRLEAAQEQRLTPGVTSLPHAGAVHPFPAEVQRLSSPVLLFWQLG